MRRAGVEYDIKTGRVGDVGSLARRFYRVFDQQTMDIHDWIDWCLMKYWAPEVVRDWTLCRSPNRREETVLPLFQLQVPNIS